MLLLKSLFVSVLLFGFGETLEEHLRCTVGDAKCERLMYNGVLEKYARGIPEYGLISIDPMELKDISVSILGVLNLTLVNGVGRGIHKCKFTELTSSIADTGDELTIHKVCNITVDGLFKISFSDPAIKKLLGVNTRLDGEGNGTLELNGFNMFLDFPYTFSRHDDGEIYIKSYYNDIIYTKYEFKEIKFAAKELLFDSQETNNFVEKFLNENSSFMMTAVGKDIVSKCMQFYHKLCETFFAYNLAKLFFKGDLAPFVTN